MASGKKPKGQSGKPAAREGAGNILSMTGFGRGAHTHSAKDGAVEIEVELRAANHRFLDFAMKLPRAYAAFEHDIRSAVSTQLERGRVEVSVQRRAADSASGTGVALSFNRKSFDALYSLYEWLYREKTGIAAEELGPDAVRDLLCEVLKRSEVLSAAEQTESYDAEREAVFAALEKACGELSKMRRNEGARLAKDLAGRRKRLEELAREVKEKTAATPDELKKRLTLRLKKVAPEILADPQRMAAEIALMSDKIDVTEELVRLESHLAQFDQTMGTSPNGKKLEFLLQEIGREFNTIGSKVQNAPAQGCVVEAKVEIEKIREQVQNIL